MLDCGGADFVGCSFGLEEARMSRRAETSLSCCSPGFKLLTASHQPWNPTRDHFLSQPLRRMPRCYSAPRLTSNVCSGHMEVWQTQAIYLRSSRMPEVLLVPRRTHIVRGERCDGYMQDQVTWQLSISRRQTHAIMPTEQGNSRPWEGLPTSFTLSVPAGTAGAGAQS